MVEAERLARPLLLFFVDRHSHLAFGFSLSFSYILLVLVKQRFRALLRLMTLMFQGLVGFMIMSPAFVLALEIPLESAISYMCWNPFLVVGGTLLKLRHQSFNNVAYKVNFVVYLLPREDALEVSWVHLPS